MGIQIKKFRAPSLQKAIEMIRSELGDNAIILQTESIPGSKGLGVFGKDTVEVTAGIDRAQMPQKLRFEEEEAKPSITQRAMQAFKRNTPNDKAATPTPKQLIAPTPALRTTPAPTVAMTDSDNPSMGQIYAMKTFLEPLKKEVDSLRDQLGKIQNPPKKRFQDPLEAEVHRLREDFREFINEKKFSTVNMPNYVKTVMQFWLDMGMPQKQVLAFLEKLEHEGLRLPNAQTDAQAVDILTQGLKSHIQEGARLMKKTSRVVVLVGPTGVGKTTTIAKMAAHERLKLGRSVCLLTLDDYKIGGSDQLGHYARILEVPYQKVRQDMSLEEQVLLQDADTVFIDTFGVSPKDETRFEALRQALRFRDPELKARLEIHLTMSVNVAPGAVNEMVKFYSALGPEFILFTKWDETTHWGGMLTAILESGKPVSYICNGQSVPDDISVFSKQSFIEEVLATDRIQ